MYTYDVVRNKVEKTKDAMRKHNTDSLATCFKQ